jgi:hypothetical protein
VATNIDTPRLTIALVRAASLIAAYRTSMSLRTGTTYTSHDWTGAHGDARNSLEPYLALRASLLPNPVISCSEDAIKHRISAKCNNVMRNPYCLHSTEMQRDTDHARV